MPAERFVSAELGAWVSARAVVGAEAAEVVVAEAAAVHCGSKQPNT